MKKLITFFCMSIIIYYGILPFIPRGSLETSGALHTVYLTTNQIHTSFLFPKSEASDLLKFIPIDKFKVNDYEGIEISFGDKDFFVEVPTWDKVTLKVLINALFSSDKGLMHVDLFKKNPPISSDVIKIQINDDQYNKLVNYILKSFEESNNLAIIYKDYSYYGTDRFFHSTVNFHLFRTCNNWVWEALAEADIKRGMSGPHKWGILYHLK